MIEVRHLVKRYGPHVAVDDLSFTVQKGQIYGFLGPNGAGKSTTMNIMTGYLGLTEGEVIINGHSIADEPELARRSIGYLPEQPPLYADMTVYEYLVFAAELKKLPPETVEDAVGEVMELVGITDHRDRLIRNLSKGYKQRVGLAQAILGFPEVIILDEPTVGLDPKQILEIRQLIRSLAGEHTIILSSHILSEVQELCDHIIIIHRGRLVAGGTPEELERELRGTSLEVTVRTDDDGAAVGALSAVPGVKSVTVTGRKGGELGLSVEPEERDLDLREAVSAACAASSLPLLMLRPSGVSLETIFLELTSDTGAPAAEEM